MNDDQEDALRSLQSQVEQQQRILLKIALAGQATRNDIETLKGSAAYVLNNCMRMV